MSPADGTVQQTPLRLTAWPPGTACDGTCPLTPDAARSVAVGYAGFGLSEILAPARTAKQLYEIEPGRHVEVDKTVALLSPLMGARDLSMAAAIFTLHRAGRQEEMGAVIVAGTILCVADTIAIGYRKGAAL